MMRKNKAKFFVFSLFLFFHFLVIFMSALAVFGKCSDFFVGKRSGKGQEKFFLVGDAFF